jgi:antitoxin component of RelBE/YafQ-DinJ toxin-antitoxin module
MRGMNVTLSIDDRLLEEARRIAANRGTSLNQMIRDYLQELTQTGDVTTVVSELESLWSASEGRSNGAWTRDQLHER